MTHIERNEDIDLPAPIPDGCYLHRGNLLQQRAKSAGIPFGLCRQWVASGKAFRWQTAGLIIRLSDRERMTAAAQRKEKTTGKVNA
jgi:hypothetical protein